MEGGSERIVGAGEGPTAVWRRVEPAVINRRGERSGRFMGAGRKGDGSTIGVGEEPRVSDGRGQSDLISGSECGRQCKVEGELRAGVERKEAGQRDGRDLAQVQEDGSSLGDRG